MESSLSCELLEQKSTITNAFTYPGYASIYLQNNTLSLTPSNQKEVEYGANKNMRKRKAC